MIKKLTTTILLALAASICFAQQNKIPFEGYNVAEGLPEEYVYSPIQDDKGYIWFGTQNGLVKYDGYRFQVFRASGDKSDTASLQVTHIGGGLLKSKDGKIWIDGISTDAVICSFDPLTEKFKTFYPGAGNAKSFEGQKKSLVI